MATTDRRVVKKLIDGNSIITILRSISIRSSCYPIVGGYLIYAFFALEIFTPWKLKFDWLTDVHSNHDKLHGPFFYE